MPSVTDNTVSTNEDPALADGRLFDSLSCLTPRTVL